jgi:FkbM family methyltransferase
MNPKWPREMVPIKTFQFESDFFSSKAYEIVVEGRPIRYVDSTRLAYARLTSLFNKEPTTIPWLESFRPTDTVVDIGANIGMYSIYAAAFTGCRVFSFEPESLNYAELNKNIHVNGLHERVSAFCLAMDDHASVDYLNLGTFGVAYSHHDFSENTWVKDMDWGAKKTPKDARIRQGCVSTTLDELVESGVVPVPDHIKIDVDGLEHKVIAGCRKTLARPEVQSVLLEVDFASPHSDATLELMESLGWRYSWDQLFTNRSQVLTREFIDRLRKGKRDGMNYIFFKDERYDRLFSDFLAHYTPPIPIKK